MTFRRSNHGDAWDEAFRHSRLLGYALEAREVGESLAIVGRIVALVDTHECVGCGEPIHGDPHIDGVDYFHPSCCPCQTLERGGAT